jgi:hypothetical protein
VLDAFSEPVDGLVDRPAHFFIHEGHYFVVSLIEFRTHHIHVSIQIALECIHTLNAPEYTRGVQRDILL